MHFREGLPEIVDKVGERTGQGRFSGNHHIVETGPGVADCTRQERFFQAAANAIARDGRAKLFGDGEPKTRRGDSFEARCSRLSLQQKAGRRPLRATTNGQEIGPFTKRDASRSAC
jgi:hypothetical protein